MKSKTSYQVVNSNDSDQLVAYFSKHGQMLLPMVDLIQQSRLAVDELIDVVGRATIQTVLELSAQQIAGPRHPGKKNADNDIRRHGRQDGQVRLSNRKLQVSKPRLRRKGKPDRNDPGGEVEIPAYQAMQNDEQLGVQMLDTILHGVSTRSYERVIPEMAATVGVSKSAVSRQVIEASEAAFKKLCERRFDDINILIIYIDGQIFGKYHMLTAVGVDDGGRKHVLGMREGAGENAVVVKALLEDLVQRGIVPQPDRRRLFVIDGSKALRCGIDAVFGSENPVQRCRKHKIANVIGHLPLDEQTQARRTMQAAYHLEAAEGVGKLRTFASWLQREHPSAAASLLEGLEETFTINRLDLPDKLRRCLATTNLIESPQSGVRMRTRRVTNWQDGSMAQRWAASAWLTTEKHFRRIMGHEQLWMLEAKLKRSAKSGEVVQHKKVG